MGARVPSKTDNLDMSAPFAPSRKAGPPPEEGQVPASHDPGELPSSPSGAVQSGQLGDRLVELGQITREQLAVALEEQKRDGNRRLLGEILVEKGFLSEAELKGSKAMRLGDKLIAQGLISKDQLQIALLEQKSSKKLLGQILVEMGFLTESALSEVLAESSGTRRFDAKSAVLDPNTIRMLPKEIAVRQKVLPVSYDGATLEIAMVDVYNVLAIDQVRRHFPRHTKVIPLLSTEGELSDLIDQYYDYEMSIDGILREIETGIRENSLLSGTEEGYINPTVRLVDALLVDAIKAGVSDIHFEPEGSFLRLRYRIDGQMLQVRSFHRDYWAAIAVRASRRAWPRPAWSANSGGACAALHSMAASDTCRRVP